MVLYINKNTCPREVTAVFPEKIHMKKGRGMTSPRLVSCGSVCLEVGISPVPVSAGLVGDGSREDAVLTECPAGEAERRRQTVIVEPVRDRNSGNAGDVRGGTKRTTLRPGIERIETHVDRAGDGRHRRRDQRI